MFPRLDDIHALDLPPFMVPMRRQKAVEASHKHPLQRAKIKRAGHFTRLVLLDIEAA